MEIIGGEVATDVDQLVELVKKRGKISLHELISILKKDASIVQSWVDFLVEENILGMEYKFITPYVYFNKETDAKKTVLQESFDNVLEDKSDFFKKMNAKGIPIKDTNAIWKKYLEENMETMKRIFYVKAKSKNFSETQVNGLWEKYYDYLKKEEK